MIYIVRYSVHYVHLWTRAFSDQSKAYDTLLGVALGNIHPDVAKAIQGMPISIEDKASLLELACKDSNIQLSLTKAEIE